MRAAVAPRAHGVLRRVLSVVIQVVAQVHVALVVALLLSIRQQAIVPTRRRQRVGALVRATTAAGLNNRPLDRLLRGPPRHEGKCGETQLLGRRRLAKLRDAPLALDVEALRVGVAALP